jgi:hypothetical protein
MYKHKLLFLSLTLLVIATSCKKQLNVGNPNAPTLTQDITNASSLAAFAQGTAYIDGFQSANAYNWLGSGYFSLNYSFSELLGDMVGSTDANESVNTVNIPFYTILDDGSHYPASNNEPQSTLLRTINTRAESAAGYNVVYYQWANMYILNGSMNVLLAEIPNIKTLTADQISTFQAWAYFWKGYAYSVIGSQYTAGLVVDTGSAVSTTSTTNGNYVGRDAIITASNTWLNKAATVLGGLSGSSDYTTMIGLLVPGAFQGTPHGGAFSTAQWLRNINTLLARNILVNKLSPFVNQTLGGTISKASIPAMAQSDWQSVQTLTANGIQTGDPVFTATSTQTASLYSVKSGNITLMAAGPNGDLVFQPGLRFTQNFNAGDQRLLADFTASASDTFYNDYFSTTYSLINTPNGTSGDSTVYSYSDQTIGAYELFIAGSWEENTLMQAEADIMLGSTETGLGLIDAERKYQGAFVAPVAGTGLTQAQAYNQLVRERRVALFGRGLSFWDSRRWGWTYDISNGGGSYGNEMLLSNAGGPVMYHNVTFDYNFMDYWDVPADEIELNPPTGGTGSVVKNPNY